MSESSKPRLRPEVLRFARPDGGVDLLDLLFDRIVPLSVAEAAALAAEDPVLLEKLAARDLCEGAIADSMRQAAWSSRARHRPSQAAAVALAADFDWTMARELPPIIAGEWRRPERLRRLAEDRLAGRRYLAMPGILTEEAASRIADAVEALSFKRMDSELVHAERHLLAEGEIDEWRGLMASPIVRKIFGAVLGVELPARLFINGWLLRRNDYFSVHPDGRLYRGTLSLGLCRSWSAADGGAIAFGDPTPEGFLVRERWLPHLGDALLFAPDSDTWHVVEPVVTDRVRLSLTGWWAGG